MARIIEVTARNNVRSNTKQMPSDTTLREAFEALGVEYAVGVVSLDGSSLPAGSMDKSFDECGVTGNRTYLMVTVKADNASDCEDATPAPAQVAQIKIIGNTVHIISSQKLEDVKLLAKYRPGALVLTEGSGAEKKEIFNVFAGKNDGSIQPNGIIFGAATTGDGKAMVTMKAPEGTADVKAWAQEEIGVSILLLKKVEAQFAGALDEVKKEKADVAASIEVA